MVAFPAALIFFAGVAAIVIEGLFKDLRPHDADEEPLSMAPMILVIMLLVGTVAVPVCRPTPAESRRRRCSRPAGSAPSCFSTWPGWPTPSSARMRK